MTTFHPTSELVTCAWISSIPDFPLSINNGVMTQAPKQEQWPVIDNISQIVTCSVVGGTPTPNSQVPVAKPVMDIRAWAARLTSDRPPWFMAAQLLELIRIACYERDLGIFGRALTVTANSVTYNPAVVQSTLVHIEPRRIYGDKRNYAVYEMEVGFAWKEVNLVISGA